MRQILLVLSLLVIGCKKETPPAPAPDPTPDRCAAQINDLEAFVRRIPGDDSNTSALPFLVEIDGVTHAEASKDDRVTVSIDQAHVVLEPEDPVDGKRLELGSSAAPGADALVKGLQAARKPTTTTVHFMITHDAPWQAVVAAVDAARAAGYPKVDFFFAHDRRAEGPPGMTQLQQGLDALDPGKRQLEIARRIEALAAPCEAWKAVLAAASSIPPQERRERLRTGLVDGWATCGCKPSLEVARTVAWATLYSIEVETSVATFTLGDGKSSPISHAPTDTWGSVAASVLKSSGPLDLASK